MIPKRLKISGFLSYQESVELDFSNFDLACVSGSNGAGKSSLFDAITWALFGQARRRDEALINSHSDKAEVIFDFLYENNTYRVTRSNPRGKSTLLDFFVQENEEKWHTLSERTLRETEQKIQDILRLDYDTFINASFFLQGKADLFAQQRPGDRKKILSTILGLEIWETYREQAAEKRKLLENEVSVLDNRIEEINKELQLEEERRKRLKELQEDLQNLSQLKAAKEEEFNQQRRLQATLQEQGKLVKMLSERLDKTRGGLEQQNRTLTTRREEHQKHRDLLENAEEIEKEYENWQNVRRELEEWEQTARNFREYESRRSTPLMQIENERSRLQQELLHLEEQEKEAVLKKENVLVLAKKFEISQQNIDLLTESVKQKENLEVELRQLLENESEALAENKHLKLKMEELKERINQLSVLNGSTCPLCGQPLSEEERKNLISELQNQGTEQGNRYRENLKLVKNNQNLRQELDEKINSLKKADQDLRTGQREHDQTHNQLLQFDEFIKIWEEKNALRLVEIRKILKGESFAGQARQELATIDAELKEIGYDSARHETVQKKEQENRAIQETFQQLANARAASAPLEREIRELEEQIKTARQELDQEEKAFKQAEEQYQSASENLPDLVKTESELFELQENENKKRLQLGGALQAVEVLGSLKNRVKDLSAERERLTFQISRFKNLERSFGKDGVPALLIEQALPEIEEQANNLLDKLTSGEMSVRFETQQEYKDKKRNDKRETLNILISDSAGMRDYEMFSGGEAFRVNFAIRLALSRILAKRAGARLQTLVIDEGFGSQDSEGRQKLVEAINLIRDDFEKILVITHLEELKDAFSTRIEVEKTRKGSTVRILT